MYFRNMKSLTSLLSVSIEDAHLDVEYGEDNDGQIILMTGLYQLKDGSIINEFCDQDCDGLEMHRLHLAHNKADVI